MSPTFPRLVQPAHVVRTLLFLVHAGLTGWVAIGYERSDHPLVLLAVAALPLAQASLLAIWIVGGRWLSYVRVPAALIGLTAVWALECHALGLELADDRSAAYALAFAVQTILVGGLPALIRLGTWLAGRRRDRERSPSRVQFSVGFILGWVGAVGLVLGAWKLVLVRAGWPWQVIEGRLFLFGAVVGAYNAAFALIMLAGLWWGRRWWRIVPQGLFAAAWASAIAASQGAALQALFGVDGNVFRAQWVFLAGFQAVYLLVTLVPIRLVRYNPGREVRHGTATGTESLATRLSDTS